LLANVQFLFGARFALIRDRVLADRTRQLNRFGRGIFTILRRYRPLIATRQFGIVTRADDVREVLGDFAHFTVPFYEQKMAEISGPFILGLDNTPLYRHDHAALRAAIRSDDVQVLTTATLNIARERLAADGDRLDIVTGFVEPTVDRVMSEYFGTPGPDTATQVRWSRSIFEDIFLNVADSEALHQHALSDAAQMRPHLDAQIAERRATLAAGGSVPDDVLTRLLTRPPVDGGLHDISVRHNLIGLIAGWIPTVSKAFTCAIDELLRRPDQLERAQRAARAGDQAEVSAYLFEALRFRPQTWALLRTCAADCTVAAGTRRATEFRAGSKVLVATQSAMFDERSVSSPGEFRTDRGFDGYLHFGHGLHMCFGLAINRAQLPALALALLDGPAITRAPGDAGNVTWDGPYPASLTVERFHG
jgi:cytochrome P450